MQEGFESPSCDWMKGMDDNDPHSELRLVVNETRVIVECKEG
jgi:hypothetical protein